MKRVLLPVAILTVLYLAALALWPEYLNHNSEYQWPVLWHGVPSKLWPAALALLVIIAVMIALYRAYDWEKITRRQVCFIVLITPAIFFLLQLVPMTVHCMGLLEFPLRVYLPDHTSYFTDAVTIENYHNYWWQRYYPVVEPQLHTHSRTHPPGAIMFFEKCNTDAMKHPRIVDWYFRAVPRSEEAAQHFNLTPVQVAGGALASAKIILAVLLLAFFIYGFAIGYQEKMFLIFAAILFFAFTPVFSNKTPILDQFFAFIIWYGIAHFFIGLRVPFITLFPQIQSVEKPWIRKFRNASEAIFRKSQPFWGIFSGLYLVAGLGYSYTSLAAFPLLLLLLAAWCWKTRTFPPRLILVSFLIGAAMGVAVYIWIWKLDFIAIWRANEAGWYFNNTTSGRIHMWKWILFNPYEFFAWLGVPVFCFFALAVWREAKKARLRKWGEIDPLVWAIFIFGLALDLSGRVCYESPRLAWFYAPFVCLVAAKGFANTKGLNRPWALAVVLALQAATVLLFRMLF